MTEKIEVMGRALARPACEQGDREESGLWQAFGAVYEECLPSVLWYTLYRVQDPFEAEDLVATTFERALRAWPSFRYRSSARRWVLGIARHVIADYYRGKPVRPLRLDLFSGELAGNQPPIIEAVEAREDAERLMRAVAQLSDGDRDLVGLRYAARLSYGEIASLLGAREGTVRVRMHRVMDRLRTLLETMGGTP